MSADLSPQNEQYIQDTVAQGLFQSRGDALDAAVELLKRRNRVVREVSRGIEELERGEGRPLDIEEIMANIHRRLAEEGKGS